MGSRDQVVIDVHGNEAASSGEAKSQRYSPYSEDAADLAISINTKLSMLASDSISYGAVSIYKVPDKHRNQNKDAYTPRKVSIGPLHHGGSQVQAMQEYKLKYLNNFLQTFRVPLELLAEFVHSQEKFVLGCYEDAYTGDKKKISEMILLDGVFIVELFLKKHFREMREIGDIIFENAWVSIDVLHDLLLLENQLPLRFLSTLYKAFVSGELRKFLDDNVIDPPSFNELAHGYFKSVGNTGKSELGPDLHCAKHLVEFLAMLHVSSNAEEKRQYSAPSDVNISGPKLRKKLESAQCSTATELLAAGVKFQHGTDKCLFKVKFEEGKLTIPQLTVNDLTETFFRNVIALEQSGYHSKYMTSYVILLDYLIDTYKDVDLLIQHEIIKNQLGSSEEVADVFNNLYKEFVKDTKEFYYADICLRLNEYSRDIWHKCIAKFTKWYTTLEAEYFATPWSFISLLAASILLILTVIQTVCSMLQV